MSVKNMRTANAKGFIAQELVTNRTSAVVARLPLFVIIPCLQSDFTAGVTMGAVKL